MHVKCKIESHSKLSFELNFIRFDRNTICEPRMHQPQHNGSVSHSSVQYSSSTTTTTRKIHSFFSQLHTPETIEKLRLWFALLWKRVRSIRKNFVLKCSFSRCEKFVSKHKLALMCTCFYSMAMKCKRVHNIMCNYDFSLKRHTAHTYLHAQCTPSSHRCIPISHKFEFKEDRWHVRSIGTAYIATLSTFCSHRKFGIQFNWPDFSAILLPPKKLLNK